MTKEELEQYARENRKRLDAQEVKIGDVVKVLVGQFAGETGIVVGIIACDKSDYTNLYYEIALNCEVPEKYKCRKTLVTPNNVAGGFSAHDFEVIGNRAPKQPSSEIKVGDKVRMANDTLNGYRCGFNYHLMTQESEVVDLDDSGYMAAILPLCVSNKDLWFQIPTKYLIKVEEEKKEPKFKVNDVVRTVFNETTHITSVLENGNYYLYGMGNEYLEESLTLVEPYTEPTEEKTPEVTRKSPSEKKYGSITIPVEVDLTDSFWATYTADLAKELAVRVANKYNDPKEVAEYAVSVAKAVVEGLKRE